MSRRSRSKEFNEFNEFEEEELSEHQVKHQTRVCERYLREIEDEDDSMIDDETQDILNHERMFDRLSIK